LSFHEIKKFQEWSTKVEKNIKQENYKLKESCKRLIYWGERIAEKDVNEYDKIRDYEISLISKAIPIIFNGYHKEYFS